MSSARSIAVKLPHARLPDADWADCFEIDINNRRLTAIEAARLSMGRMPDWVRRLVGLRNFLGHRPTKTRSAYFRCSHRASGRWFSASTTGISIFAW